MFHWRRYALSSSKAGLRPRQIANHLTGLSRTLIIKQRIFLLTHIAPDLLSWAADQLGATYLHIFPSLLMVLKISNTYHVMILQTA